MESGEGWLADPPSSLLYHWRLYPREGGRGELKKGPGMGTEYAADFTIEIANATSAAPGCAPFDGDRLPQRNVTAAF